MGNSFSLGNIEHVPGAVPSTRGKEKQTDRNFLIIQHKCRGVAEKELLIHLGGSGNRKPWGEAESQKTCRNHPGKRVERLFQAEERAYDKGRSNVHSGNFWVVPSSWSKLVEQVT